MIVRLAADEDESLVVLFDFHGLPLFGSLKLLLGDVHEIPLDLKEHKTIFSCFSAMFKPNLLNRQAFFF
jgi:hypothetical protein